MAAKNASAATPAAVQTSPVGHSRFTEYRCPASDMVSSAAMMNQLKCSPISMPKMRPSLT
jgi:hypothetical protein